MRTSFKSKIKLPILFFGDIFFYYVSLILTLYLRYGEVDVYGATFSVHIIPFSIGLLFWIFIFYVGGMYERVILRSVAVLNKRFFVLNLLGGVFLILLLYFVPRFGIAPKTNLLIFLGVFSVAGYSWRFLFGWLLRLRAGGRRQKLLLIGNDEATHEIARYLTKHGESDYEVGKWMRRDIEEWNQMSPDEFAHFLLSHGIVAVIVPARLNHNARVLRLLYSSFLQGVEIIGLSDFYERLFDRVSIDDIEDAWVLARLPRVARSYQLIKYWLEGVLALALLIVLSPIFLVGSVLVKMSSRGPVFYRQVRVGEQAKNFLLYKFRTMYSDKERNPDADAGSAMWSAGGGDNRVTAVGRFLRATHIDELPQLVNIIRGEMSFIGPRPERPEFTGKLEQEIPYYELRYLLKPGITGWAQINYRYGSSVEDAKKKLQYEVYYLKNRSLWLDVSILLKTLKRIFINYN